MSTDVKERAEVVHLVDYGPDIEDQISKLEALAEGSQDLTARYNSRWLAVKLLEEDADIRTRLGAIPAGQALLSQAEESVDHLGAIYGEDVDTVIADRRYGWINGLVRETVRRPDVSRLTLSDRIDGVVTSP